MGSDRKSNSCLDALNVYAARNLVQFDQRMARYSCYLVNSPLMVLQSTQDAE